MRIFSLSSAYIIMGSLILKEFFAYGFGGLDSYEIPQTTNRAGSGGGDIVE